MAVTTTILNTTRAYIDNLDSYSVTLDRAPAASCDLVVVVADHSRRRPCP